MNENTNNNSTQKKINISSIIRIFLSYWPWYILSCTFFLIIAAFYLKYSSRTYSVSGSILIKTGQMRPRSSDTYVNVNDLMNQEKNLSNEINYIRSSPVLKEVIEDMNLFTSYYIKQNKIPIGLAFGLNNIYKDSPFLVIVDNESIQPINTLFYVSIIDENRFFIHAEEDEAYFYNFENEEVSDETQYFTVSGYYNFGDIIKNNYCSFKIILNSNYNPEQFQNVDLFFKFNSPLELAYEFQKLVSINSNFYESSIAHLTFQWENVDLALEFLTNLIDKYISSNLDKKNYDANNTISYIEEQLANISTDLNQSERQLQNFRTTRDMMNIDDKSRELRNQLQELERNRDLIQSQYNNLLNLRAYFEDNKNSQTFIAPTMTGMSDQTLATLIQELTTLSREKQNLISTNQLKNPRIKTLDANMASIIKVITDNINFSLSATQNELDDINKKLDNIYKEYSQLPKNQRQLLELEREFNINDEVYTSLLNRRIQAKIIKASNRPDVEVIEPVRYYEVTSPSPKMIGIIFLFLGIFFPSIYIVIINFLTSRIRSTEDLSNFVTLKSIGEIPHHTSKQPNVITNYPNEPIVERFHFIRSNLIYYLYGKTNQTILVTSTLPNEGKSFTSLNLALSFSSVNYKTLLIAFDLRRNSPTLNELRSNALIGLDSYLINKANIEDIITSTDYPNLHFISNGQIPPNPVSLLSSPRIDELFQTVRSYYDYIIIDTPPFGLVADSFLLMKHSDIKLYVSRLGTITKKALKHSMEEINSKKIDNIYIIKNDLTRIDKAYYTKYSYREEKKSWFSKLIRFKKTKNKYASYTS